MTEPKVGDPAPEFELPSHQGGTIRLSQFRGRSNVVVFFYPKDKTSVCTVEACSFRDHHGAFADRGDVILGISMDPVALHQEFAKEQDLNYPLLADVDGSVAQLYGALGTGRDGHPSVQRITFVINKEGQIQDVVRLSRDQLPPGADYSKTVVEHVPHLAATLIR
ncbi:MAG: peroxiredoxin [Thermoplasmata archaeon]|nr:peroxiredoxin [Thermoplasmata archaeon]